MQEHTVQEQLQKLYRNRNRQRLAGSCAFGLVIIGIAFGFVDRFAEKIAPLTDYHRILFTELARQHFVLTGTPTIVKEDDFTLELFERQYDRTISQVSGFPTMLTMPFGYLWQFSYAPGGINLTSISFEDLQSRGERLTIRSPTPVVVWVYSAREGMLACFGYQMITANHPLAGSSATPEGRMIESLDWNGKVSTQGSVPTSRVLPTHGFLIPFRDLKLSNLDRHATEDPNLALFDFALPLFLDQTRPVPPAGPSVSSTARLAGLREQAAQPFLLTQRIFRLIVLPIGCLLFVGVAWSMNRLRRRFESALSELRPNAQQPGRKNLMNFSFGNLKDDISAARAEASSIQQQLLANQKKQAEIEDVTERLGHYAKQLGLSSEEGTRIERALSNNTADGLRQIVALLSEKAAAQEREQQLARERQRETVWIEAEFEMIPQVKRAEAQEAWELYERALQTPDPKNRLHFLKEARKKLPRDLKPDRV